MLDVPSLRTTVDVRSSTQGSGCAPGRHSHTAPDPSTGGVAAGAAGVVTPAVGAGRAGAARWPELPEHDVASTPANATTAAARTTGTFARYVGAWLPWSHTIVIAARAG